MFVYNLYNYTGNQLKNPESGVKSRGHQGTGWYGKYPGPQDATGRLPFDVGFSLTGTHSQDGSSDGVSGAYRYAHGTGHKQHDTAAGFGVTRRRASRQARARGVSRAHDGLGRHGVSSRDRDGRARRPRRRRRRSAVRGAGARRDRSAPRPGRCRHSSSDARRRPVVRRSPDPVSRRRPRFFGTARRRRSQRRHGCSRTRSRRAPA